MTDSSHRFSFIKEGAHELHSLLDPAQLVRIQHATRQEERVEIGRVRVVERDVHGESFTPLCMAPCFHFVPCWRKICVWAPASSRARLGSVSSTSSKPFSTRMATLFPFN